MIPKIIHQTAPKNKNDWHFIWEMCHESWKNHFPEPEYKHIMWTDEDLHDLIATHYKQYFNLYNNFPLKIIKIDFARFCMLDYYGGIYADMDIYCYANFYRMLTNDIHIMEGCEKHGEKLQNSLMCSTPKHTFWQKCFNHVIEYSNLPCKKLSEKYIFNFCGPIAISNINEPVSILPNNLFDSYSAKLPCNITYKNIKNISDLQKKSLIKIFDKLTKKNNHAITTHLYTGKWFYEL